MSTERPDWIPGSTKLIEWPSPRVVMLESSGPNIRFGNVPARARIHLRFAHPNIQVSAESVGGGGRLVLIASRRASAVIRDFPKLALESGWLPNAIVTSDAVEWTIPPIALRIRRPNEAPDADLSFEITEGESNVQVSLERGRGQLAELVSHTSGTTTVARIRIADGARIRSAGPVSILEPLNSIDLRAPSLSASGEVRGGRIRIGDGTFGSSVLGEQENRVRIEGESVDVAKEMRFADVVAATITLRDSANDCTFQVNQSITVQGNLVRSRIHGEQSVVVVGAPIPSDIGEEVFESRRDHLQQLKSLFESSLATGGGQIEESVIEVSKNGSVSASQIKSSDISVDGRLLVRGECEFSATATLTCSKLLTTSLRIESSRKVSVQAITALEELSVSGVLELSDLTVGSRLGRMKSGGAIAADATVKANTCFIDGEVDDVRVEANHLEIRGALLESAKVVIGETATVAGDGGAAEFSKGETSCELEGWLGDVTVPVGSQARLTFLGNESRIQHADVGGRMSLWIPELKRVDLDLRTSVDASLSAEGGERSQIGAAAGSAVQLMDGAGGEVEILTESIKGVDDAKHHRLQLTCRHREMLPVFIRAPIDLPVDEAPVLQVEGDIDLRLSGLLQRLRLMSGTAIPTLSLGGRDAQVSSATGIARLGPVVAGRIHGSSAGESEPFGLSIVDLEVQDPVSSSGLVLDADLTQIPFGRLERLEGIGVVDPTASSMIEFAKRPLESDEATAQRAELRSRSEHAARLVEVVGKKAIPGSSLAAAKWASARLHHRSLPKGAEKILRYAHKAVGYSQRPLTALASLIATVLIAVGLRLGKWAYDGIDLGWDEISDAIMGTILLPFSVVRFASFVEPLFFNRFLNLVIFSALALTFLFFVIAMRNYLKTPGD